MCIYWLVGIGYILRVHVQFFLTRGYIPYMTNYEYCCFQCDVESISKKPASERAWPPSAMCSVYFCLFLVGMCRFYSSGDHCAGEPHGSEHSEWGAANFLLSGRGEGWWCRVDVTRVCLACSHCAACYLLMLYWAHLIAILDHLLECWVGRAHTQKTFHT